MSELERMVERAALLQGMDLQIAEAVAAEREACAKIAEDFGLQRFSEYKGRGEHAQSIRRGDPYWEGQSDAAGDIAGLIRERGEK